MIVDFHTHTFPDAIAARAIAGMQQNTHAAAFSDGTVAGLTASMTRAGIRHSVVLPVATNPAKLTSINDASIANNGKDGLIYFGAVHPQAEDWEQQLIRIADAGLKGIKLHPQYQNTDIDDIRCLRILDKAAQLGLLVVTHAGQEIAYPGMLRCTPQMIRAALRQVGPVSIVLAHMGGWKDWDAVVGELADTGCYLDTAFSLGSVTPISDGYYSPQALQLLDGEQFCRMVDAFGADRVLFGTDSPWACQETQVAMIEGLPLTEKEKQCILGKNACRLLQIPDTGDIAN